MPVIPIYNSRGDADAFLEFPYLYNRNGDWIGWITPERDVYSVIGNYVGYLTSDRRIFRKRSTPAVTPRKQPPKEPGKKYPPATIPLAPLMSEVSHSVIDVLQDEPERLHSLDIGEMREDLD